MFGRLIDLFNSPECTQFLEDKKQQARIGLESLENAMSYSLYEGMQEMRKLVTDIRIHQWSEESSISRFQFSAQSIHFVLTCAYDIIRDEYITNKEKIRRIWEGITEASTLD